MKKMKKSRVESGVEHLDQILGGLFIGDNVVWYDDAGSLAQAFCRNFLRTSLARGKPFIYVSFDRSPKNLLEQLGSLAKSNELTILDCFTYGKGAGSEVFLRFYEDPDDWPCRIIRVNDPQSMDHVSDAFYGLQAGCSGDVHFIFESLTGMQDLWNGEENLLKFYSHTCPRLYELQTVAYWIIEKRAHTPRLRANINQIAQVAIELSVRRGKTALTMLKAENRTLAALNKPYRYWTQNDKVSFASDSGKSMQIDLGARLKDLRTRRGLSQSELAKLVGVTASTISQVEGNQITPSLPALFKMAEVLGVAAGAFFQDRGSRAERMFFSAGSAVEIKIPHLPGGTVSAKRLTPLDFEGRTIPYIIEIPPGMTISGHFFSYKGEELGYLLSGSLEAKTDNFTDVLESGDVVYLKTDTPSRWRNIGTSPAKLLWIKIQQ